MAMDGRYAENAGAFFGGCLPVLEFAGTKEHFLAAMDGGHAENAGALFGRCLPAIK
jgi:hypothetical protein